MAPLIHALRNSYLPYPNYGQWFMKKHLEKQAVFNQTLKTLHFLSQWKVSRWSIVPLTRFLAQVNVLLNRPKKAIDAEQLASRWKEMMPPDGQEYFKIREVTSDTAYAEIHPHCPLRGSGNPGKCHEFMNYDRQLMKSVGGQLVVLESQSNSGKNYCQLAIRKEGANTSDLQPAHKIGSE